MIFAVTVRESVVIVMNKKYIEREAFIKILKETKNDCKHYADKMCCDFAIRMVNLMPSADVQEVRHGKWIINSDGYYPYCSECKQEPKELSKFCPNCGAKMDKE